MKLLKIPQIMVQCWWLWYREATRPPSQLLWAIKNITLSTFLQETFPILHNEAMETASCLLLFYQFPKVTHMILIIDIRSLISSQQMPEKETHIQDISTPAVSHVSRVDFFAAQALHGVPEDPQMPRWTFPL